MEFVERMKQERNELKSKINKLVMFVMSCSYEDLNLEERLLLLDQQAYMTKYLGILEKRIYLYGNK